jgi:protein phosphatase
MKQSDFLRHLLLGPDAFPPPSATVHVEIGAASRQGTAQPANTDHFVVCRLGRSQETLLTNLPGDAVSRRFDEQAYGLIVADGMGEAGELASALVLAGLQQLAVRFGRWNVRVDDMLAPEIIERITHFYRQIDSALVHVNRAGQIGPLHSTMTGVLTAGKDLFFAHVGHSRAYLYRSSELIQMTRDHTHAILRDRARAHLVDLTGAASDVHHILTDALGAGTVDPEIDVERLSLADGDQVMVCTNGLTDVVDDLDLAPVLGSGRPVQEICDALVARAFDAGASDDVTVLLARYHVPA